MRIAKNTQLGAAVEYERYSGQLETLPCNEPGRLMGARKSTGSKKDLEKTGNQVWENLHFRPFRPPKSRRPIKIQAFIRDIPRFPTIEKPR